MDQPRIVFLGPTGATFSYDAYTKLASHFGTPQVSEAELIPVSRNDEILKALLLEPTQSYGAIAMETQAEGRVAEPLEAFIRLLNSYPKLETSLPLQVIGGIKLSLNFALMVRPGMNRDQIKGILAHPKALGACSKKIQDSMWITQDTSSNGKAAEDVATVAEYKAWAALGPAAAAQKYQLQILDPAFEDKPAKTTFFLLGPNTEKPKLGSTNRILIVYRLHDKPGALVDSLLPFKNHALSLTQIHSVYIDQGNYDFAIELECRSEDLPRFKQALVEFRAATYHSFVFGPFEIIEA